MSKRAQASRRLAAAVVPIILAASSGFSESTGTGQPSAPVNLQEKTAVVAEALAGISLEGWKPGEIERYVVANLYDKINGRSELFMSYGVEALAFISYTDADNAARFIDVYLYDMGSVAGAFGVYSVERWQVQELLGLGREGYRNGNDLFFWKGRYYASILASENEPEIGESQMKLAGDIAGRLDDNQETLWGFDVLPTGDIVPNSIQYFMVDALSLSFLSDTFTALYRVGSNEISAFVSRADSEADAKKRLGLYVQYMGAYGSELEQRTTNDIDVVAADMGGGYVDAVGQCGRYVAGVSAVPDREGAVCAAGEWIRAFKR